MPGATYDQMQGSQDTGYVAWNVPYINIGKSVALSFKANTYISLDGRSFYKTNRDKRPAPVVMDEMSPGAPSFFTIFSGPIAKSQFDAILANENGISVFIDYTYVDEFNHPYHGSNCYSRLANGAIAQLQSADCRKKLGE